MMQQLTSSLKKQKALFESFLENWLKKYQELIPSENQELIKSFRYALEGGKRFRPLLVLAAAKAFKADAEKILPFACAVEFIHTYSLIHDDLPAIDNSDKRRGKASHHKVFGEATSILTGDALLTEAFNLAIREKAAFPYHQTSAVIYILVVAAGGRGMVSGQMLDLKALKDASLDLEQIHFYKTGSLITSCVLGTGHLSGVSAQTMIKLKEFGDHLGCAFQIADDLEDIYQEKKPETKVNCAYRWGVKETLERLAALSAHALNILDEIPQSQDLQDLVKFNLNRVLKVKR